MKNVLLLVLFILVFVSFLVFANETTDLADLFEGKHVIENQICELGGLMYHCDVYTYPTNATVFWQAFKRKGGGYQIIIKYDANQNKSKIVWQYQKGLVSF